MALIHDAADVRLIVFRIAPGQAVPVHTSGSTVVLHVLSGSGTVSGADGERSVAPGTVVAYEPGEPHGMRATTEELTLLATITPRPANR
jgi:quercetin dioxygenase-like cupin family protein